jgi:predicted dehydrogenase
MAAPNPEREKQKIVSLGVIGAGFGQRVHVPAFRLDPRCEVAAMCASSLTNAQKAADAMDIPRAFGDWRALLADPAIDAVTLAVPPAVQAEIALAALRAGKHVFCEKPLAATAAQAREIVSAAAQSRVAHAMDFIFPEIPAWQKAREMIPTVGRLRFVSLIWHLETHACRLKERSWKTMGGPGGGALGNFASHTFHYLEWFFGPIVRIAASLRPAAPEAEPGMDAWLEFASGLPANVSIASDAFLGPGHCLGVYGEDGTLRLENLGSDYVRGFELFVGNRLSGQLEKVSVAGDDPAGDGRVAVVGRIARKFLDAILTGRPAVPNLYDGLRVQQILDIVRIATQSRSWQNVPSK